MPFLPSLPDPAHLMDLYARFPENVRPLMDYTDGLLRGEGELSVGERELIATYVSALNACTFCAGAHRAYAEVFGIDGALIDALIEDVESAPVDERLRPVLAYVAKLNELTQGTGDASRSLEEIITSASGELFSTTPP